MNWWSHLLFVNNYTKLNSLCLSPTWYLGVDFQLFCFGLGVMMLIWKFPWIARIFFPSLLTLAILIPCLITYVGKYDALTIFSPEIYRTLFVDSRNYQSIFIASYTNASSAVMGLWSGYLLYYAQKMNYTEKLKNSPWFPTILYPAFPMGLLIVLSGIYFYKDGYVYNPTVAAIYAGFSKALFVLVVTYIIITLSCEAGGIYATVLEWPPFRAPAKLTYAALFIHGLIHKPFIGCLTKPFFIAEYPVIFLVAASVTLTYIVAVPVYIMVELPASNLIRTLFNVSFNGRNKKSTNVSNYSAVAIKIQTST